MNATFPLRKKEAEHAHGGSCFTALSVSSLRSDRGTGKTRRVMKPVPVARELNAAGHKGIRAELSLGGFPGSSWSQPGANPQTLLPLPAGPARSRGTRGWSQSTAAPEPSAGQCTEGDGGSLQHSPGMGHTAQPPPRAQDQYFQQFTECCFSIGLHQRC